MVNKAIIKLNYTLSCLLAAHTPGKGADRRDQSLREINTLTT